MVCRGLRPGAKSLIWASSELLFAFFLTEAIGLPPSRVGLIAALSLFVNAGMDLILGWTIRRVVTSCRTASRMQLFGLVAAGRP